MTRSSNVTIIRAKHDRENPYFMMRRNTAQDEGLSFEARGVLAYLFSKPEDWRVNDKDLQREGGCGRDRIRRILGELEEHGYLRAGQDHDAEGKFTEKLYMVYEEPQPLTEKPLTVKPLTENPLHTKYREAQSTEKQKTIAEPPAASGSEPLEDTDKPTDTPALPTQTPFKAIQETVVDKWFKGDWANASWAGGIAHMFQGDSDEKQYKPYNFDPPWQSDEFKQFAQWLTKQDFEMPTSPMKLRRHGIAYREAHPPAASEPDYSQGDPLFDPAYRGLSIMEAHELDQRRLLEQLEKLDKPA